MLFSNLYHYLKGEKNFDIKLNCSTDLHEIRDVELLDGTQTSYSTDIVYFGYSSVLSPDTQPSQCILVDSQDHLFPYACTDRATVNANELFAVFNAAKQFIQTQEQISLYEELVRKGNSTHSVDEVVNFASIKIGNCLIFCDKKFRILSYSTSIPVTDVLWKENIERGYCTYEFISNVMSLEAVQSSSANIEAIEVSCPESPYRKCSSKVFLNGVQVGFVLMIESVTAFTTEHLAAMSDISRAISFVVGRYHPELLRYSSADQQLLEALLIGTPAELLKEAIAHLHMSKTMADLHLDVGISLVFSRMDEFCTAYQQARDVLELNRRIPDSLKKQISWDRRYPSEHRTHRYSEIEFYELMDEFEEPQKLIKYVHPALYRLWEYDQETGNELYHTLEIYLQSFHNNKETANLLCIHRNSLAYRMEKICDIAKIDLNDSTTEFLLRLSYKLAEYLAINELWHI